MEGASGLAGLIKAVFALEKGLIPPNLWFEKANPRIPLAKWGLDVSTGLFISFEKCAIMITGPNY